MYHDLDDAMAHDDFTYNALDAELDRGESQLMQALRSIAPRVHGEIVSGVSGTSLY